VISGVAVGVGENDLCSVVHVSKRPDSWLVSAIKLSSWYVNPTSGILVLTPPSQVGEVICPRFLVQIHC